MALDAEAELARNRIDPLYRADAETRGKLANVFALSGNAYELLSQALAAYTAPDKDLGIVLSSSQQSRLNAEVAKSKKREDRERSQLTIAEQARLLSERLARQIEILETTFEAQYGDAWIETIANKAMEPDDVPQRRPGESMTDYRQRLESVLIATLIDPSTGEIRPEFANSDDPEIRRYAIWAQAKHTQNRIEQASDAELEEIVSRSSDLAILKHAESGIAEGGVDAPSKPTRTQLLFDEIADSGSDSAAFPNPSG